MKIRPLSTQRGYLGISLGVTARRKGPAAASGGFFLLADGSSKFLLANATDKFLTSGG